MASRTQSISITVDGVEYTDDVEPRLLLVQYLREVLGKTGTVIGCDTTNCGACTVLVDGDGIKSCTMLAVEADGHEVTTIEGMSSNGDLHPLQKSFNACRSEEHTSELQSRGHLVCRLLLEKKK